MILSSSFFGTQNTTYWLANCIWLFVGSNTAKRIFYVKFQKEYIAGLKIMIYRKRYLKLYLKTNRLWKLPVQKLSPLSETEIRDIKIELRQKFRSHCCPDLDCTDNASRRYFFRSVIVYVREINAYVLTNCRKIYVR